MKLTVPPVPPRPSATRRRARAASVLAVGALAVAALAACGDPLAPSSANNVDTQSAIFVLAPLSSPASVLRPAISLANAVGASAVRPGVVAVSGTLGIVPTFDFAVDLAADGRVRLIPAKLVAGLGTSGRTLETGFQVVRTPFDSVFDAPSGGYARDSATVVAPGQAVVIESSPYTCYGLSRPNLYSKAVVDSVSANRTAIYLRLVIDPNCGFRSLRAGKPTS